MTEPVRVDLYGTEEGLLREAAKHSVNLDLEGFPRAETVVPRDLTEYDHQGQEFAFRIDGGPPEDLNTYEHRGRSFQVSKKERDKSAFERIKSIFRRDDIEVKNYLARDASQAFNEIENGALLFEVRGRNEDSDTKTKGEPVRAEIKNKDTHLQRLNLIENMAEDNEILDNDLLKSKETRYLGCSHYASTSFKSSPYESWKEMNRSDLEVAAYVDVGLDYPAALGYLGDRYNGEPTFGYRIEDQKGRADPSKYTREEETIARELDGVIERVETYLED